MEKVKEGRKRRRRRRRRRRMRGRSQYVSCSFMRKLDLSRIRRQ